MKNRTVKFRGFTIDLDYNVWNYGFLVGDYIVEMILEKSGLHLMNKIDMKSIGQFTGLYDINNKEIYEGDIVHYKELSFDKYKVKYHQSTFIIEPFDTGYTLEDLLEESYSLDTFCVDFETTKTKFEIVGNSYENK